MSPKYKAVVFDMDGVLADSEPIYHEAVNVVLAPLGKYVTPEVQRKVMGHGVYETWEVLERELALEGPFDALISAYDTELCKLLALHDQPLPGVRELLRALQERGVPFALASSSWPGWIEALLDGIGLSGVFDIKVSSTMVEHGKPAPDVYLLAAQRLGIEPAHCIAIEDTTTGLTAAKAAGMLAVQVQAASTAFPPLPEADLVIATLADFDMALLG